MVSCPILKSNLVILSANVFHIGMGCQIGKKAGTGHFGWVKLPSFMVSFLRKNLFVERLASTVDGSAY